MKCIILSVFVAFALIVSIECNSAQSARGEIPMFDLPGPIWGDVMPPYFFQSRLEKFKVPFITRCSSIKYPFDMPNRAEGQAAPRLRGISHVNLLDKSKTDCADPDVWIDDGSITGSFVKVKVCSKAGCPLDSVVYFYTQR